MEDAGRAEGIEEEVVVFTVVIKQGNTMSMVPRGRSRLTRSQPYILSKGSYVLGSRQKRLEKRRKRSGEAQKMCKAG